MRLISILLLFIVTGLSLLAQDFEVKDMPAFKLEDNKGRVFESSKLEGKFVLIDFWASWCGPCHKAFPDLIKLYNDLHDKGLEIVGISTDLNKVAWLADLEKINLPWIQLLDGQGNNSVATNDFRISSIPALFLVDPDGRIIARNPGPEQVKKMLNYYSKTKM